MAKFEIHEFDTVVYPRKVWVAKGGTKKDIADLFEDSDGDPYWLSSEAVRSSYALTDHVTKHDGGSYGVLVWLHSPANVTTGIISHEADHAANMIFAAVGAKVDCRNDEPHAYLVGFIADCIDKVRKGKI